MSFSDPIADMLTRVRNAGRAHRPQVSVPVSKMKTGVADVLKRTGYIADWQIDDSDKKQLIITLKYTGEKRPKPVIEGLKRVSKPSRRVYAGSNNIPRVLGGFGVAVLSTSHGILSGKEAREQNVGGEILCYVW